MSYSFTFDEPPNGQKRPPKRESGLVAELVAALEGIQREQELREKLLSADLESRGPIKRGLDELIARREAAIAKAKGETK